MKCGSVALSMWRIVPRSSGIRRSGTISTPSIVGVDAAEAVPGTTALVLHLACRRPAAPRSADGRASLLQQGESQRMPADSNARSARVRARSIELTARLSDVVPGGAHTYAKGEDQYPEGLAPVIARGHGSHVWDVDGNDYIEYGSGLRAVSLGHAHPRVVDAVARALELGSNFVRPAAIEIEAAERFLATVGHEMVKFAKNGSDATTAAVRLA